MKYDSDVDVEYAALTQAAGLIDLSHWSRIRFQGSDCRKFLHGLLTNDILNLKPLHGCHSCILTPKGKLLADFDFYDRGEDFLAIGLPLAGENLKNEISKKIMLSDSRMEDQSEATSLFYLAGPKSRMILEKLFGSVRDMKRYEILRLKRNMPDGEQFVEIASSPWLTSDGMWLIGSAVGARFLWADMISAGQSAGLLPVGWDAVNVVRIERGVPLFGIDMNEETIPLEAQLEEAISFTKGCYMGQETITRIKSMGHVNKMLTLLRVDGPDIPPAGAPVIAAEGEARDTISSCASLNSRGATGIDGLRIGTITSAARSPRCGGIVALSLLRAECNRPGTAMQIFSGNNTPKAHVI